MVAVVDPLESRPVFFFDIDNCLYPRSRQVHEHMQVLIDVCVSYRSMGYLTD